MTTLLGGEISLEDKLFVRAVAIIVHDLRRNLATLGIDYLNG